MHCCRVSRVLHEGNGRAFTPESSVTVKLAAASWRLALCTATSWRQSWGFRRTGRVCAASPERY